MSTSDEEKSDLSTAAYSAEEIEALSSYYRNHLSSLINRRTLDALNEGQLAELQAFDEHGIELAMPWLGLHHPRFLVSGDLDRFCVALGDEVDQETAIVALAKKLFIEESLPDHDMFLVEEVEEMSQTMGIPLGNLEKILGLVRLDNEEEEV